jgi:alpha-ketoglutarate-dependent taurine dioxygenase
VSWQVFFHTKDRSEVEDYCRKAGIDFEWKSGGVLRMRKVCSAVARHPRTGELVFFNQLQLHHPSLLERSVRETLGSMFSKEEFPRNVYYGDGSPIEDSLVSEICGLYRENCVSFPWRKGDILMLDNMLVAHARNPYVGPRRIVVAMGELISEGLLESR